MILGQGTYLFYNDAAHLTSSLKGAREEGNELCIAASYAHPGACIYDFKIGTSGTVVWIGDLHMMASFDYNYQNPPVFIFLVLIRAIVI